MNFTAVLKRMAKSGFDVHVTVEHNGWMHISATHKGSSRPLTNERGDIVTASALLHGDREYNVMAVLDVIAINFWKQVNLSGR